MGLCSWFAPSPAPRNAQGVVEKAAMRTCFARRIALAQIRRSAHTHFSRRASCAGRARSDDRMNGQRFSLPAARREGPTANPFQPFWVPPGAGTPGCSRWVVRYAKEQSASVARLAVAYPVVVRPTADDRRHPNGRPSWVGSNAACSSPSQLSTASASSSPPLRRRRDRPPRWAPFSTASRPAPAPAASAAACAAAAAAATGS